MTLDLHEYIYRKLTKHIESLLGFFPVIAIIGPRQVGKTSLVLQLIKKIPKDTFYIDLESPEDLTKLKDSELFFKLHLHDCLAIDEVQRKKELFPILRSVIDKNRVPARFILTGSASPDLIRDSSESLAGRIAYIQLQPFHIDEIDYTNMYKHWLNGGFPISFLTDETTYSSQWRTSFIDTYIERDLPLLGLRMHAERFRIFISILAHVNAQTLNYSQIAKSIELSIPTIKNYIDFLVKALLVRKINPYISNTKKRLIKSPKIYFTDTGILHSLLRIKDQEHLLSHNLVGFSWETYIVNQIAGILKDEYNLYFYKTSHGAEVDLLIEHALHIVIAIEIKMTNAPKLSKGNHIAFQDVNADENYVITPTSDTYPIKENIRVISIKDFIQLLKDKKMTLWE